MLRKPALCRSRLSNQKQRPVRHKGGNGNLHQTLLSDVFGGNLHASHPAAADISPHRAGRHPPARRHRVLFRRNQRVDFFLKELLSRQPLHTVLFHFFSISAQFCTFRFYFPAVNSITVKLFVPVYRLPVLRRSCHVPLCFLSSTAEATVPPPLPLRRHSPEAPQNSCLFPRR